MSRGKGSGTRFKNSLRNSSVAFVGQILTLLLGFGVRWLFVRTLGKEYLGVNSVMESMLALLSMTELGIGTSVAFALYQPIDDGDERRIGTLMAFYRKTYHVIGLLTAVLGPLLIPFMHFFTREATAVADVNLIYLLFLANTVISYFFAYKRTLLSAYQCSYVNSVTEDLFAVLKYVLQGVSLVCFKSFIGYLVINVVCTVGTNIVISVICDKKYPFTKAYRREKLYAEDKAILKKSIVSLMYQKIGAKLVTGTDNLMISYANIALMGVYSNYAMIVSIISRIVFNVLGAITGSIGNLMVQKDKELKYNVFEEFVFATFAFYCMISVGMAGCLERFIALWAGEDWVLPHMITFVVILNFFLTGMRQPNVVVIEAAGLFNRLRMKAVGEVVVNLVVSFVFLIVFQMGIYGVLFGTTVSMVSVCIWWETLAVHRYALEAPQGRFYGNYCKYLATAAVGCFAAFAASEAIPVGGIPGLLVSGVAAMAIFALLIFVLFWRSRPFKALLARFTRRLSR